MISIGIREPVTRLVQYWRLWFRQKLLRNSGSQPPSQNAGNSSNSSNNQIVPAGPVCPDGTVGLLLGCESGLSIAGVLGGSPTIAAAAPESSGREPVVDPSTLVTISDVQSIVADGGTINVSPNRGWVYAEQARLLRERCGGIRRKSLSAGQCGHFAPDTRVLHMGFRAMDLRYSQATIPAVLGQMEQSRTRISKTSAEVRIGLTVEWSAAFTVGGTTYPVDGTATSTTQSDSFDVREAGSGSDALKMPSAWHKGHPQRHT